MDKEMNNGMKELAPDQMEAVSGGVNSDKRLNYPDESCSHPKKVRTGAEREDSRLIFFSQHQFQYYCPDCDTKFWLDEER